MRKSTWNTYAISVYSYDVANDRKSQGGVHLHQVRNTPSGWQHRILQSNGIHEASGPVDYISDPAGEVRFATAKARAVLQMATT